MTIIALEEHYAIPEVLDAWQRSVEDPAMRHMSRGDTGGNAEALADLGEGRLAAMDRVGVDRQVLSLSTPGVQDLATAEAEALQVAANDRVAEAVREHPDRFGAFATLATPSPEAAAAELGRAVTHLGLDGAMIFPRSQGRPLDHADFWPVFEAAEALGAPLYLHPQVPPPAVRDAYYGGFDQTTSDWLATGGPGWHYDAGVAFLRLVLAGVFDRFPRLQLVLGHWGEVVLFYLDRIDLLAGRTPSGRPVSEYVAAHVHVTPAGIFSPRYLRWATEVVGVDRILFAVDHPFVQAPDGAARAFLDDAVSDAADREKIASGNWDRLRAGILR